MQSLRKNNGRLAPYVCSVGQGHRTRLTVTVKFLLGLGLVDPTGAVRLLFADLRTLVEVRLEAFLGRVPGGSLGDATRKDAANVHEHIDEWRKIAARSAAESITAA